jgi:1,3-beta-glucan synthase
VIRFAILYFVMLFVFLVVIVAPLVLGRMSASKSFLTTLRDSIGMNKAGFLSGTKMGLLQPLDAGLNDTVPYYTGSGLPKGFSSSAIPSIWPVVSGNGYTALRV